MKTLFWNIYVYKHINIYKHIWLIVLTGYIGDGMLSASVSGYVFTCCSSLNIYQAIKYLNNNTC